MFAKCNFLYIKRFEMNYSQTLSNLKIKIFADGADFDTIIKLNSLEHIRGFTTNPTLMRKSGIEDYEKFSKSILEKIQDKPISLEVFADDIDEMYNQAKKISSWGNNINIKIPITNTKNTNTCELIANLCSEGIKVNVTAIFTINQIKPLMKKIDKNANLILSVFAGRIADTGIDPIPTIKETIGLSKEFYNTEVLWASPRELLNIFQADEVGCHIITIASDIINKLILINKGLNEFSRETVEMFYSDALKSKFKI